MRIDCSLAYFEAGLNVNKSFKREKHLIKWNIPEILIHINHNYLKIAFDENFKNQYQNDSLYLFSNFDPSA